MNSGSATGEKKSKLGLKNQRGRSDIISLTFSCVELANNDVGSMHVHRSEKGVASVQW